MNKSGTAKFGSFVDTPAAIAMYPSSAIRPSRKVYAGSSTAFLRTTSALFELSTPVIACGYRNNASADPSAKVAYACFAGSLAGRNDAGFPLAVVVLRSPFGGQP